MPTADFCVGFRHFVRFFRGCFLFAAAQSTPGQSANSLTTSLRAHLLVRQSTAPTAWLAPGLEAACSMAHPPRHQPSDWSVGAGGFAHLYSGYLARQSASTAAQFIVAALLEEDTCYRPSTQHNPLRRAAYAAVFPLFDRRVSGRRTVAVSSFAAAFTAAALANTWLPAQFRNSAHLTQRTLTSLAALSGSVLAAEFHPEAIRLTHRLTHPLARACRRSAVPQPAHCGRRPVLANPTVNLEVNPDVASGRPS